MSDSISSGEISSGIILVRELLYVSSGGVAIDTTLNSGYLYVLSGGIASSTFINSDGVLYISSGGVANDTINSGGDMQVFSDGTANRIIVNSRSRLYVRSGGTAMNVVWTPNIGTLSVDEGGYVTYANLPSGVYYGTSNTPVVNNKSFSSATMYVMSGGITNNVTVNRLGEMYVFSGGEANNTKVNSFGILTVSSGGTATNIVWTPCAGYVNVLSGGTATFASQYSGVYYDTSNALIMDNKIISSDMYVMSGGTANSTTLDRYGMLYVSSGGTANHTTNYYRMYVYNEGVINNTLNGGLLYISSGGIANNTVDGGSMYVSFGGIANDTIVNEGQIYVSSGGKVNRTTISGNTSFNHSGVLTISLGGAATSTNVLFGGSMLIENGGMANNALVNLGGYLQVNSGGTASIAFNPWQGSIASKTGANVTYLERDATVYYGGWDHGVVSKNDTIKSLNVESGLSVIVYSGGTAMEIQENGGHVDIQEYAKASFVSNTFSGITLSNTTATLHSNTIAENTTVRSGGRIIVFSCGIANSTFVSSYGSVYISSGGIANSIFIYSGGMVNISIGGMANSTTVNYMGQFIISSGGTANNTIVNSNGFMSVASGGTAAHIVASSGALFDFSVAPDTYIEGENANSAFEIKDGIVTYYSVNYGNTLRISSGGIASRTYVYTGGNLNVSDGGKVSRTTVSNGTINISFGGVANSVTIQAGTLHISSGGIVNSTTVNSNGKINVSEGGTGNSFTINSGSLYVSSGGVVDTVFVANNNGWLYVYSGGTATNISASNTRLCFTVAPDTLITGTSSGSEFEIKDGIVSNYTINTDGWLNILDGTAHDVRINGGSMFVRTGGKANNTIANNYANMWVSAGGVANDTVVNVNANMRVSAGGVANDTAINNGGKIWIYNGATANGTTVYRGGSMYLSSGGVASSVRINSGGNVTVEHAKLTGKITIADGGVIHAGQGTVVDFDISHLAPGIDGPRVNNLSLIKDDAPAFTLTVSDLQWNGEYTLAKGVVEFDNLISIKSLTNETIHMVAVDDTSNVDGVEYTLKLIDDVLTVTVTGGRDIPIIAVSADITEVTTQNVTLTADFSENAIMREYSFDNDTWYVYTEPVKCEVNRTVYFLGKDQRGFVNEIATYEVTNIDKMAPTVTNITPSTTEPADSVTVTADFADDVALASKLYKIGYGTWMDYPAEGVTVNENTTVYFKAVDKAGNETTEFYVVTNIETSTADITAPTVSGITANTTSPTNQPVILTADYADDIELASSLYRIGENGEWQDYVDGVTVTENITVFFKAVDTTGNESAEASYTVGNIDKVAPSKPTATADITSPTNQDVTVTATFSADSVVKEYSTDGQTWKPYTKAVVLTANGIISFRGTDEAGNTSEVTTFEVANIDKIAPDKPIASADITEITTGSVNVSAVFSVDSLKKEYSLDNGETWQDYTSPIAFTTNGTVLFRGIDAADNVSEVASYEVANIETVTPDTTKPSVTNVKADITALTNQDVTVTADFEDNIAVASSLYRIGETDTWIAYKNGVTVNENTTVHFKAVDTTGNESEVVSYEVKNIDKIPPLKPTATADITDQTNAEVKVSAVFSEDSIVWEYSRDGQNWNAYTDAVSFTENGVVYFRGKDEAGNVSDVTSYTVNNITSETVVISSGLVLTSGKSASVLDKEVFIDTVISSGGVLHISSGGKADSTVIYQLGSVYVSSGGMATNTFFSNNGIMHVLSGGKANSNMVHAFAKMNISNGGLADDNTILGYLHVSSGGTANNNVVSNGGSMFVSDGGIASSTAIINGIIWIGSGGTATDIEWTPCEGQISIEEGAEVSFVSQYYGVYFGSSNQLVSNAAKMSSMTLNNFQEINVLSGGETNSITIDRYGNMYVSKGGTANNTILKGRGGGYGNGILYVSSGGTANDTAVNGAGWMYISNGGMANNVVVNYSGNLNVSSGGVANNTTVSSGGVLNISFGGRLTGQITLETEAKVSAYSGAILDFDISNSLPSVTPRINDLSHLSGWENIEFMLTVSDSQTEGVYTLAGGASEFNKTITVQNNSRTSLGTITVNESINIKGFNYSLHIEDKALILTIENGTPADTISPTVTNVKADITALTNQNVKITADFSDDVELARSLYRIGETDEWTDYTDGVIVSENTTVYFKAIDAAGNESEVASYTVGNIDNVAPSAPSGLMAVVSDPTVVLIWNPSTDDASGIKEYVVNYSRNGQEFTAAVNNTNYVLTGLASGSWTWSVQAVDLAVNKSTMTSGNSFDIAGTVVEPEPVSDVAPQTQTWKKTEETTQYVVEYSTDNFEHVIRLAVASNSLDSFQMPAGNYQWRVKPEGGEDWIVGEPVTAIAADNNPKLVKSNEDGNDDLFFAKAIDTWEAGYVAQHVGSINDWNGTNEYAAVNGKNKFVDIIEGSTDANILLMTDDDNGDALFVDDIYTDLPGSVEEQQSRIAKIDEIRAGSGDDIVDMTSQRFEYIGEGLTIRGGEGNDTIWANKGDNKLFGDAGNDRIVGASGNDVIAGGIGNDRMHGGGGDDVFTFYDNWSVDNVEQLATGSVTLWFASGSIENWDKTTLTYTDGDNSVKVSGVTADKITLKFGDDGSAQFASLTSMGAFFDATTERIFEESGKGILAGL